MAVDVRLSSQDVWNSTVLLGGAGFVLLIQLVFVFQNADFRCAAWPIGIAVAFFWGMLVIALIFSFFEYVLYWTLGAWLVFGLTRAGNLIGTRWRGAAERWKQHARQLKIKVYTLYLVYRDPRVPWYVKAFTAYVMACTFSPIDLIPDFIPVLGRLDDLALTPLGIALTLKMVPNAVLEESRRKARDAIMRQDEPANWVGVAVVIAIWLMLITAATWIVAQAFTG